MYNRQNKYLMFIQQYNFLDSPNSKKIFNTFYYDKKHTSKINQFNELTLRFSVAKLERDIKYNETVDEYYYGSEYVEKLEKDRRECNFYNSIINWTDEDNHIKRIKKDLIIRNKIQIKPY